MVHMILKCLSIYQTGYSVLFDLLIYDSNCVDLRISKTNLWVLIYLHSDKLDLTNIYATTEIEVYPYLTHRY